MDCNILNQGMELDRGIQVRSMGAKNIPNMLISLPELDMDGTLEVLESEKSHTNVKGISLCIDAHLNIMHSIIM